MNLTSEQIRKLVVSVVLALLAIQILWPPKQWSMTSPFGARTESLGRAFIFSDPMADGNRYVQQAESSGWGMGSHSSTHIDWGSHLLTLLATAGAGAAALAYLSRRTAGVA